MNNVVITNQLKSVLRPLYDGQLHLVNSVFFLNTQHYVFTFLETVRTLLKVDIVIFFYLKCYFS